MTNGNPPNQPPACPLCGPQYLMRFVPEHSRYYCDNCRQWDTEPVQPQQQVPPHPMPPQQAAPQVQQHPGSQPQPQPQPQTQHPVQQQNAPQQAPNPYQQGHQYSGPYPTHPTQRRGLSWIHWTGIVVGLVIVSMVLAFALIGEKPEQTKEEREVAKAKAALKKIEMEEKRKKDAYSTCKKLVKERLKAPTTARFPRFVIKGPGQKMVVLTFKDGRVTILSRVSSKNIYGMRVRYYFTCKLKGQRSAWRLIDLYFYDGRGKRVVDW